MDKKLQIFIGIAVLILAAAVGYYVVVFKNKADMTKQAGILETRVNEEVVKADLEYKDAAGFSFMYPKSLEAEDITPDEDSYYSKVRLSKIGSELSVIVKDETEKTVDEYILSNDYFKNAVLVGAINLAKIPAKQYEIEGKLITLAIKDGILYLIEGKKDAGFWEETQDLIISTFSFGFEETSRSSDNNTTYESEIIVE